MSEPLQLELFLAEYGQNNAHIVKLENEARDEAPLRWKPQRPADPWPPHIRFD